VSNTWTTCRKLWDNGEKSSLIASINFLQRKKLVDSSFDLHALRPAASVRSEPGSNSQVQKKLVCLSCALNDSDYIVIRHLLIFAR
jgi:hypothetical protein